MKYITCIALLLIAGVTTQAQQSDYDQVASAVNFYLDGGTNNDFETLKKAFHPAATMKFIRNGEYQEVNALEFFKKGMKPGPKQNRNTSISYINVAGEAASAQLLIEYPTFSFVDYMNLLKIDGEWKIVSKIFHRRMKMEAN